MRKWWRLIFSLAGVVFLTDLVHKEAVAGEAMREQVFFQSFEGQWSGQGKVVAGKYKGMRFSCNFTGWSETKTVGMSLDGSCRIGLLRQTMRARVTRHPSGNFLGVFNDGARAQGMDITAARIGADHVQFDLNRQQLQGIMMAQLTRDDLMSITLSVKVLEDFVRVVDVSLKRSDRGNQHLAKASR